MVSLPQDDSFELPKPLAVVGTRGLMWMQAPGKPGTTQTKRMMQDEGYSLHIISATTNTT